MKFRTKTTKRAIEAAQYIAVAVLVGLIFNGIALLFSSATSYANTYGGVYLTLCESLLLGIIGVSLYQSYKEKRLNEIEIIKFAQSYSRPDRPGYVPTAGEFEAFLNTPNGVDAIYKAINDRSRGRKPLASAAKLNRPVTTQEPVGVM